MSTLKSNKVILFFTLFFFYCLVFTSCEKKNKEEKTFISPPKIDAQVLTEIAEANLKVVAITQKAQENQMEDSTRKAFQKVENQHLQIKKEIHKIAENNFIIIPNILYDTNLIKKFISEANTFLYLKKTEKILLDELSYYQSISKSSKNNDLKTLVTNNILAIQKNIVSIQQEQK
ncbi:MAG TPA: hypothetical protein VJ780_00655 [Flavobacterium sp.]|nr:hypothetical protein [Flavobacterium sp.]